MSIAATWEVRPLLEQAIAICRALRAAIESPDVDDVDLKIGVAEVKDLVFNATLALEEQRQAHISAKCPALTKWAARVVRSKHQHEPLAVAAAYEAIALECEYAGSPGLAAQARASALAALTVRKTA